MFKTVLRLAGASLLMSAALVAKAGPADSQAFIVSGVFQENIAPTTQCASGLQGKLAGYGDTNGFGRVAFLSSDCFSQNGPVFTFSNGKFMITTETGELVFANYSGTVVTSDGLNGVMNGATFQITGGTGKYIRAIGGGKLEGTEELATGKGTIKLTGSIQLRR
jgi:hypothetical protein